MKRRQPTNVSTSGAGMLLDPEAEMRDSMAWPHNANNGERARGHHFPAQIHPLHEDPALHTLTPRSLAKSVAELDALRSRVHELEQKLSQHDVEILPLSSTPSKSKLPPLQVDVSTGSGETSPSLGSRSSSDLKAALLAASTSLIERIATAPDRHCRKPIAPPLVLTHASPSKRSLIPAVETSERTIVDSKDASRPTGCEEPPPSSPTSSVISTSSPDREQAKMTLEVDGDTSFAVSQRQRLYRILNRVSTLVEVAEDDLLILKKLVDAEFGDVITFLQSVEMLEDAKLLAQKLSRFLVNGSPAKQKQIRQQFQLELPPCHPVWSIQYPLQKIARNLEHLKATVGGSWSPSKSNKLDVIVLVSSGAYNPIHMLHIRAFYVARQYVESNYKFPVVGAFISPSHDTFVRVKNRRNPQEMITKRHRLGLIEAAVASSSWIEVDKWEITRRRVLDYLSTLTHVREMCETHFPQIKFHLVYVCGCNTVVKLSHTALRDEGFGCITVCRPTQTEMVVKHLGKTLAKSTTIVEDTGVLPVDLERATSFRARQTMASSAKTPSHSQSEKHLTSLEMLVGKPALQYMVKYSIPQKVAGKEAWNDEDKSWRTEDRAYVEYIEG